MEAAESSLVVKLPRTVISSEVQRSREICLEIDLSISLRSSRDDDRLLKREVVTFAYYVPPLAHFEVKNYNTQKYYSLKKINRSLNYFHKYFAFSKFFIFLCLMINNIHTWLWQSSSNTDCAGCV
jgi:hypothetical protein